MVIAALNLIFIKAGLNSYSCLINTNPTQINPNE